MFSLDNVAFTLAGYPVSMLELTAVVFNLAAVWLATIQNKLTWPIGIAATFFLAILFGQLHLYADMFLQVIFAGLSAYGIVCWNKLEDKRDVTTLSSNSKIKILLILLLAPFPISMGIESLDNIAPTWFSLPEHAFANSFMLVGSIVATILMAKKKLESWIVWILVDAVAIYVYYSVEAVLLLITYGLFLINAMRGFVLWDNQTID